MVTAPFDNVAEVADTANEPETAADPDFAALEACLTATERGRRFLDEFARRCRIEESMRIMAAIDRLESRTMHSEIDRLRERLEADRIADVARQLADALKELGPIAQSRARARETEKPEPVANVTALERRFAALVQLDGAAAEDDLKRFG